MPCIWRCLLPRRPSNCTCRHTRAPVPNRYIASVAALILVSGTATAQETHPSALALDTEAAVDVAVDQNGNDTTNLFFDSVLSARLAPHLEAIVRPFSQRLGATGE